MHGEKSESAVEGAEAAAAGAKAVEEAAERDQDFALVLVDDGEDHDARWNAWLSLPEHDPVNDEYGFVIGWGSTRAQAVEQAVKELERVIFRLRHATDIQERSARRRKE